MKKDGKLQWITSKEKWEQFKKHIPEGMLVDCYFEVTHDDGTLAQLAKVHAMIKSLAIHIGETFENMKLLVKERAGLCISKHVSGKEYLIVKSFGDCSKDELMLAIKACEELEELT